ncbi:GyrI-like domain-containing protein [Flexithrix dorotheae]|uniref:GyrI-like domain-containing protein n=1 Tax=Flexithrix dorotheae TaxID=70993 RepID=UPI0012FA39A7|nr:GyrI-like domain-containing protein [Flexithrix dorotheae]
MIQLTKFKLVGLNLEGKTTNRNNQSNIDCGNLWQRFEKENIFEGIPNKTNKEVYAVYYGYEGEETPFFSYFIGCKIDENTEIPSHLNSLEIPFQNYRKVTAKGVMTGCITKKWEEIWKSDMNRKFGFDFEIYDERSENWNDAEIDIYISIND